ncbi:MAG: prepilin peptidase [Lachnospiraceae bacterium]|nr:prepilin peptidase [Lachnospiraceae bacterium]
MLNQFIHFQWMSISDNFPKTDTYEKEEWHIYCFICCFLLIAMIMDLCCYRIKNQIILCGFLIGIGILFYEKNIQALKQGVFHVLLLFICFLPVFALQVIGAADVKLFLLIGLLTGIKPALFCIIVSFLIGAFYSLMQMLYYKNLFQRLSYFLKYIKHVLITHQIQPYHKQPPDKKAVIHFTIPIFLSFCIYWIGGAPWMPF